MLRDGKETPDRLVRLAVLVERVRLVLLVHGDSPAVLEHRASRAGLELQVILAQLVHLVHLESLDDKELEDVLVRPVDQVPLVLEASREILDLLADSDLQVTLAELVQLDRLESLDHAETQEKVVHPVFRVRRDKQVLLVQQASGDQRDGLVQLVHEERLAQAELLEVPAQQEQQEVLVVLESRAKTG